jgi:sarcosine oxidase subunit beta
LQGPAIGEILRDLYLSRQPFVDISPLSADRFSTGGQLRPESNIV